MRYREVIARFVRGIPTLNGTYGPYGVRFVSVLFGLMPDLIAAGASAAVKAPWTSLGDDQPDDALALLGEESRLERYPVESAAQYRDRIQNAWVTYQYSGTTQSLVEHLEAAGFLDVGIDDNTPNSPFFEVAFPHGYPVTGGPENWDEFTWDDGTLWDCRAYAAQLDLIRSIIRKRKPVIRVCDEMSFTVAGYGNVTIPF